MIIIVMIVLTLLFVAFVATLTIYLGAILGNSSSKSLLSLPPEDEQQHEVTLFQALIFPFYASFCLIIIFYFFSYVQVILLALLTFGSITSFYHLIHIFVQSYIHWVNRYSNRLHNVISIVATTIVTIEWLRTGSFIYHDLLACSMCVTVLSTLRFPSLKIATILLCSLVIYDIFWVFCSEYFFEQNVMVEVAKKAAVNPAYEAAKQLHWNQVDSFIVPNLELPLKLIFPLFNSSKRSIMLGLGDIVLPGALVALAYRCDQSISNRLVSKLDKQSNNPQQDIERQQEWNENSILLASAESITPEKRKVGSLFYLSLTGYFFGLIGAFIGNAWSGMAQPALIYVVPGTLLPTIFKSYQDDMLGMIWDGSFNK